MLKPLAKLICRIKGHCWKYPKMGSFYRGWRLCRRCGKEEENL